MPLRGVRDGTGANPFLQEDSVNIITCGHCGRKYTTTIFAMHPFVCDCANEQPEKDWTDADEAGLERHEENKRRRIVEQNEY